jgi:hypothetical protein
MIDGMGAVFCQKVDKRSLPKLLVTVTDPCLAKQTLLTHNISIYKDIYKDIYKGAIMTLRTTLYLDKGVVERVRRFIPQRGLSQLINDLLQQKASELEQAEIEQRMREGYLATREDRKALNEDWQSIDGEGWPA